jgi:hypothetical protein
MPVPDTNTFSLQDVETEIAGTQYSLIDCINDADPNGYDSSYYSPPATSLLEFRNYDDIPRYWALTPCLGGSTAYTRLEPPLANQRYILPTGMVYYSWNGSFTDSATPPAGFNGSIQIVAGQTGCP